MANVLHGVNHVSVSVNGDKYDKLLAQKIAGHVNDALAKATRRDGMRYSGSQKGAMAACYASKSHRANG